MAELNHVTSDQFDQQVLQSDVPVLVDFYAPWCGPCRMIAPALEQLANQYSGKAKVVKVNVDDEMELAVKYQIQGVPTLMFFQNGEVVDGVVGAPSPQMLQQKLQALVPAA
jgi:thioredoxin 1